MAIEQWIGIIFGGILIIAGLFFIKSNRSQNYALWIGMGIFMLGLFDPIALDKFKFSPKDGIEISRYQPTEKEREIAIKSIKKNLSLDLENKKRNFIKSAKSRPDSKRSSEDYLVLANEKYHGDSSYPASNSEDALALIYLGLNLKPRDIRVKASLLSSKGQIYFGLGVNDLAIKSYKDAIIVDGDFPLPHFGLGIIYHDQKKFKMAETEYIQAIRIDPNAGLFYINLGSLYISQNKYEEAEKIYKKAIQFIDDMLPVNGASIYLNLGGLYDDQKKYDLAEKNYIEAIRILGTSYPSEREEMEKELKEIIKNKGGILKSES